MAQSYGITDKGTDRETIVFGELKYWLDFKSDPQNSVGWVVEDGRGVQEQCTVGEAAAVPGAREYVIERSRELCDRVEQGGVVPAFVVAALRAEIAEA